MSLSKTLPFPPPVQSPGALFFFLPLGGNLYRIRLIHLAFAGQDYPIVTCSGSGDPELQKGRQLNVSVKTLPFQSLWYFV